MEEIIERCAGLDVHQAELTACARVPDAEGNTVEQIRGYGTTTPDLLELLDWLKALGITHVAMESTGVYWKPIYYVLEDDFEILLVNAAHIKHVPGRKTDTIDAAWIAQLLAHGLLRGSFVPPKPIRELRDLTRYRRVLMEDRTREINRLHKLLEDAGVKLATVVSDVMGVSGRQMMRALIAGENNPEALADLAKRRLRSKIPRLHKALTARFSDHHAFLLDRMLRRIEEIEADIDAISERIEAKIAPFGKEVELLDSIPGIGRIAAQVIIAEIGVDMARFPTPQHLASWAGVCPGQNESAGKRMSAKTTKGPRWLKTVLVEGAHAVAKSKGTYLSERYRQLARRRGTKKAIVAVAHDNLATVWQLLSTGESYREAGSEVVLSGAEELAKKRAIRQLQSLGYSVTLKSLPR
ncbi:MAG: IS110 family transposase, partial [Actinobacteria bacterium]|nr:IS110 family transposase [Actinomycetota bacterium]